MKSIENVYQAWLALQPLDEQTQYRISQRFTIAQKTIPIKQGVRALRNGIYPYCGVTGIIERSFSRSETSTLLSRKA